MKRYITILTTCLTFMACNSFNELKDGEKIAPISVDVALDFNIGHIVEMKDLTLKFDNY